MKIFLRGVLACAVLGFLAGVIIKAVLTLNHKQLRLVPNDMALCPQWVEESRAADQAGVWAIDVDGESAR